VNVHLYIFILQVPFLAIKEDKSDLSYHMVYSMETEDMESEPNLTADNQVSVVVKLEMSDNSEISTANNEHSAIHIQNSTIKTDPFNHRNDNTTHAYSNNSMEYKRMCFKHEYTYEDDSTRVMLHSVQAGNSVFAKSKMLDDSEIHTSDFPQNVTNVKVSKIKTESIVRQNQDCDDDITQEDGKHSAECHSLGSKHEYKDEEDISPVLAADVEAGTVCTTAVDKQHTCDTCTKSFHNTSQLKQHVRVHTGEKPYKCDTCGKSFSVKSNLVMHMKIHTDDKPFSCDTCGKTFINKGDLINHVRVHTGDKPYTCDTCSKSFAKKYNLVRHMKIHTA
jgi:DNA-directed RNA polymerase subunit RPC12/RpoP